jgi:hypothetical protein
MTLPGTPDLCSFGFLPNTAISPESGLHLPTMQLNNVVFPQPLGPSSPNLEAKDKSFTNK